MNNAYQVLLEQLPYLQKLPGNDVAYVLRDVVSEETVAGGQILFDRDDPIEHLYLVLEGEVEEMQVTRSNAFPNRIDTRSNRCRNCVKYTSSRLTDGKPRCPCGCRCHIRRQSGCRRSYRTPSP